MKKFAIINFLDLKASDIVPSSWLIKPTVSFHAGYLFYINFNSILYQLIIEYILYNCVYINNRLSLKPWIPLHENGFEGIFEPYCYK